MMPESCSLTRKARTCARSFMLAAEGVLVLVPVSVPVLVLALAGLEFCAIADRPRERVLKA